MPTSGQEDLPVLLHFRFSHYNEKVRWALDYKGVPHRRRSYLAGPHAPTARRLTGQTSLPVLVINGEAIRDSTRIIEELERVVPSPPLYPDEAADRRRALDLEEFFDEELGPYARLAFFHLLLPHAGHSARYLANGGTRAQRVLLRLGHPVIGRIYRKKLGVTDEAAEEALGKIDAALDLLEAEIGLGGYLVGDQFTVADLTAAALAAPLVLPGLPHQPNALCPEPVLKFRRELEQRPAFAWVMQMYGRHRSKSAAVEDM